MNRRTPVLAAVLTAAFITTAFAQETPGVTQTPKVSTRKNRAPVADRLLKVRFPKPKVYTLDNGLKVYILEDHRVPGVDYTLMIKAGSLYTDVPEVAEATGALLDEGTTTLTHKDIARIVDAMGAELTAGAGSESASVRIAGLSDFAEPMLDILVDVALHPSFPQDRLDDYKYRRIAGLPARKSDPDSLARYLNTRVNYGTSKYARLIPNKDEIEAISRDSLIALHKSLYIPNGATLSVVGDVKAKDLLPRIKALFAEWKPAPREIMPPPSDFKPCEVTRVHIIDRPGSQQTQLRFTNIAIPRNHPDYIPLVVANRILGAGSTGRLFQKIREQKGYTYGAYSTFSAPRWTGTWGAYASVRTEVTGPATEDFLAEFRRIQNEPVSEEELVQAKRTIIGSFARTLESPDNIMGKTMEIVRNGLPADFWETYPAKLQAVTAADVQRVCRKYLGEGRIQIIAVGEAAAIVPALSKYGPVLYYNDDIEPVAGPPAS